jgi:hypothetical protein
MNADRAATVSEEVPTDRKLITLWSIILAVSVVIFVSLVGATYVSTDWGTWRNAIISIGLLTLLVTVTWSCVRSTNLRCRYSPSSDWKIIGQFAIWIWLLALGVNLFSRWVFDDIPREDDLVWSAISPMVQILSIAIAPALWWFPIWTLASWWRARRTGKRKGARSIHPDEQHQDSWFSRAQVNLKRSRASRGRLWRLAGVTAATLACLAFFWFGDQWIRSNELRALIEEIGSSRSQVQVADDYWSDLYDRATQAGGFQSDYDSAAKDVSSSAQNLNFDLALNRERVDSLVLLPWHGDNRALRDRYSSYLDALLTRTNDMGNSSTAESLSTAIGKSSTPLSTAWRMVVQQAQFMPLPIFAKDMTNQIDSATR